jgi:hypothetical protein
VKTRALVDTRVVTLVTLVKDEMESWKAGYEHASAGYLGPCGTDSGVVYLSKIPPISSNWEWHFRWSGREGCGGGGVRFPPA